ncbi:ADP-ribosylglycohydrolase family protein [Amnibacterium setariae]|uniref:ADP-ribosylglycohydrolase family protein n=1 Tax=Amnibacterium setariae TaxID=2306585 RepID=A0A3A1UAN0_9MICO|nr:ADP-ribosylglycohydrolase family protein [Amnibacterium setariae]RIX30386.1 ADP-ribosylglycohydrolase family protein [Amnibacterium setariae]
MTRRDRALGALTGLAIGDALGMPTQTLPREAIAAAGGVTGFRAAAPDHPLAHGLPAGRVTDDTEQALLLADALVDGGGRVDPQRLADDLDRWEQDARARGSLDLLGPSTRSAIQAVREGVAPELAGANGTTNGAAMRIAPVGIATRIDDVEALVDAVEAACLVSHHTSVAIAGAAAVAAVVSAGVEGRDLPVAAALGIAAARAGARRGRWVAGAEVAARISWSVELAGRRDVPTAVDRVVRLIGTSLATQESVPAAFAMLLLHPDDPWAACCAAASLGGDTDTIAAMTGAMAGAIHGVDAFPTDAVATVRAVNDLRLDERVDALLALR